jgi:hypothetical protein
MRRENLWSRLVTCVCRASRSAVLLTG